MVKPNTLKSLKLQGRNANKHTERGLGVLRDSLQRDGWIGAMTVAADGETFDGSARLEVGVDAGFDDAIVVESDGTKPVIVVRTDIPSADHEKAKRLGIAANRVAQLDLSWDANVLAELESEGDLLSGLFSADELLELLNAASQEEIAIGGGGDEFEAEPDEAQTRVREGDVWQLGRHKIACLSSTDAASYGKLLGTEKPQMVWSDPPYGISIVATNGYVGGGEAANIPFGGVKNETREEKQARLNKRGDVGGGASHMRKTGKPYIATTKGLGSADGAKPFGNDIRGSIGAANIIDVGKYAPVIGDDTIDTAVDSFTLCFDLCPKATHFWWGGNYYAHAMPPSSCWIVWDKENTGNFADAELAWSNHKSAVRIFKHMWNGLMKASEKGQRRVHPTQKPVALAQWCFEKYGAEGDLILDPFLGSGMSVIAAERTKRRVFGLELSPDYIDVILKRYEAETGQTAELLERNE